MDYDVLIIGSGFGGSVAALRLAEKGYRVGVIEKGRRFRPEDYPRTNWNIRKSFWFPRLSCYGTWRLHLLREVLVLHGIGVGGGSLLYANTHFEPPDSVWDDPQWKDLEDWRKVMPKFYTEARRMLGSTETVRMGAADEALRHAAERRGRGESFCPTDVGVFFGKPDVEVPDPYFDGEGPARTGCTFCGACMVGCRKGAKNTLDKNYLYLAEKLGVEILPEREVRLIEAMEDGSYRVKWRRSTRQLLRKRGVLRAGKVVVSAGVLGSVSLLMKSKEQGGLPNISSELGNMVRTNSEVLLGMTSRSRDDLWEGVAIASKAEMDDVTHMECVRFPAGSDVILLLGTLMTDGGKGIPRALRWIGNVLRHPIRFLQVSKPWGKAKRSAVLLVMQTLDNHTRLTKSRQWLWPFVRTLTSKPDPDQPGIPSYIPIAHEVAREMGDELDAEPQNTLNEVLLDTSTTAHILGGCSIASGPDRGVVSVKGEVFGHPGLYVIDGSLVGANLGVNPSLTITALAEYVCSRFPEKDPS